MFRECALVKAMCVCVYSSCWTPVAGPSLRPVVAPNSPSGLTGTQSVDVRDGEAMADRLDPCVMSVS